MPDLRESIRTHLADFTAKPLDEAARALFSHLGYKSDRTMPAASVAAFCQRFDSDGILEHPTALKSDWASVHLLFQLTDAELAAHATLFNETEIQPGLHRSYLFFAVELTGDDYARGKLTGIARRINRLFTTPVMVLIKHRAQKQPVLSIAVINRRANKRDGTKDVLEKATIIRDISITEPHRGHLDILSSLAVPLLEHPDRKPINSFETLHAAWEQIFNVELLNKNFYDELANWFFWAKKHTHFPLYDPEADRYDLFHDSEKAKEHEAKNLIRLLTRILFVWFIKERGLVPTSLFNAADVGAQLLKDFDSESSETNYYKAILQNLFFATLNQTHGQREFRKEGQHHNTTTLLRYENRLRAPTEFVQILDASTPFLNGGLFECLDRPHPTKRGPKGGAVTIYEDGFSDRKDNPLVVPDFLFFGTQRTVDLSGDDAFGLPNKRNAKVRGLIPLLNSYKFTIVENTPIDQEIALDPELLGRVFENLLASYNPETKTTARKQTGSFYTPRPIVDYMVDESLKAHLERTLVNEAGMSVDDAKVGLEVLFAYTERDHLFSAEETRILINAIDGCKILDPACGSGAFPMGALQTLVHILGKLDPGDELWEKRQLAKVDKMIEAAQDIDDTTFRERAIADAQAQKQDIEEAFAKNELGYGRKLYLIENCLYGVDIQSIATQVTKLRFFISLIVDQRIDRQRENFGVRPLPNLETKFVTADTLIRVEKPTNQGELFELAEVSALQHELKQVRHSLFSAKTPRTKNKYRGRDKELRDAIADELKQNGWASETAGRLAAWDPYDQNASAGYFDPEWMFGLSAFDIVIGNPPYISVEKFAGTPQQSRWKKDYATYAARGDIYCFFYERGAELLEEGGTLVYITSNKWMRAGYGKGLRDMFLSKVRIDEILDFGGVLVFNSATVDTCTLRLSRTQPQKTFPSSYMRASFAFDQSLADFAASNSSQFRLPATAAQSWAVLSAERQAIRDQVSSQGVPIGKWKVQIGYGIKSGLNAAFYLNAEQRNSLIEEDPASDELIVKLIRGREVERYKIDWEDTYQLIIKFGAHRDLEDRYPAIYRHLCGFADKLKARGQCQYSRSRSADANSEYPGQHHWLELDNNPSDDYVGLFIEPKIIYPIITKRLGFFLDQKKHYFTNDKAFIINSRGDSLEYLTAFFNSTLFRCCYKDEFPTQGEDRRELRKIFFDKIPVKKPTETQVSLFEALVPMVQFAKANDKTSAYHFLEDLIDACVMECYFRDHMAERDLLFLDDLAPGLEGFDPNGTDAQQRAFLESFVSTHNAPSAPIRNRLLRLTADSPDLLAVIKKEGKV